MLPNVANMSDQEKRQEIIRLWRLQKKIWDVIPPDDFDREAYLFLVNLNHRGLVKGYDALKEVDGLRRTPHYATVSA